LGEIFELDRATLKSDGVLAQDECWRHV
jgi:hypothetical protein